MCLGEIGKDGIGNDSAEAVVGIKSETDKTQNRKNIVYRLWNVAGCVWVPAPPVCDQI